MRLFVLIEYQSLLPTSVAAAKPVIAYSLDLRKDLTLA
jgi:hypothetical protein